MLMQESPYVTSDLFVYVVWLRLCHFATYKVS